VCDGVCGFSRRAETLPIFPLISERRWKQEIETRF
jgi:hypothetical protein